MSLRFCFKDRFLSVTRKKVLSYKALRFSGLSAVRRTRGCINIRESDMFVKTIFHVPVGFSAPGDEGLDYSFIMRKVKQLGVPLPFLPAKKYNSCRRK
jgi:hypothetical protein